MPTVLIIDDMQANIALLAAYLQMQNIFALSALSGKQGYEMARDAQPDLILLDLRMPEYAWDGYETLKHLRNDQSTRAIPVIAVTAAGNIKNWREQGFVDLLQRPFSLNLLEQCLQQYLVVA